MISTKKILSSSGDIRPLTAVPNTPDEMAPLRNRGAFRKTLATMEIMFRLALMIVSRFWKLCTTGLLIVTLLFWAQGGSIAFSFFILGIIGLMYHAQDMLLYHPESPPDSRIMVITPDAFQLPYENQFIRARDGTRINVVLIKQMQRASSTIIFFHGNAGNIGHRLQNALGLYSALNANVLMVEYRGYGKSEGSESEGGLYQDAEAALDFLLKRTDVNTSQIMLFGRSLGGAVAIYLAAHTAYSSRIAGLIVENTFTSIFDMGLKILQLECLKYIPKWCFKNKFSSIDKIELVRVPTLFLSGTMDELVPPKMMKDLYNRSKSSLKRLEQFASGTHNDTWMCPGYYESLMRFVPEALRFQHINSNLNNPIESDIMESVTSI